MCKKSKKWSFGLNSKKRCWLGKEIQAVHGLLCFAWIHLHSFVNYALTYCSIYFIYGFCSFINKPRCKPSTFLATCFALCHAVIVLIRPAGAGQPLAVKFFSSKILTKGDAITSYPIGQTSIIHQPAQFLNLLGYVIKEILFLSFFPVYRKCKKWQTTFGQIIRKFNFHNFSSLFSYKRTINTGIWNDIANIISSAVFL